MTALLALLRRDLYVASRNSPMLLTAGLTQPILVVLVFGHVLRAEPGGRRVPHRDAAGLMAIRAHGRVQGVLMPLMTDLAGNREVDERLLAPSRCSGWP